MKTLLRLRQKDREERICYARNSVDNLIGVRKQITSPDATIWLRGEALTGARFIELATEQIDRHMETIQRLTK